MADNAPTSEEAKRIAEEAMEAVRNLAHATANLPVDTAKMVLGVLSDATGKVESVVRRAGGDDK